MVKRIINFLATAAVALLALSSCEKAGNEPINIEFSKNLYTVYQKGKVDVILRTSRPVSEDVEVNVLLKGPAILGEDYMVYADKEYKAESEEQVQCAVKIDKDKSSGSLTIEDLGTGNGKSLNISIVSAPSGLSLGTKTVTVVAPDNQEGYVAEFNTIRAYAYESLVVKVSVTGSVSEKEFKPSTDLLIPLKLEGENSSELQFVAPENAPEGATAPYAVIPAGQTKAYVKFNVADNCSGGGELQLTFDTESDSRVIEGNYSYVNIAVRGLQTPDKLVGTWDFSKVYSTDEIISDLNELFETSVDGSELPIHNDGFTLTFTKESDGSVKLTPSGKGDFSNFFRECTVTLAEPMNITKTPDTTILGKHTAIEGNMYVANDENASAYQYNTYYKLSSANRAFSADTESLGEAVVVFSLTDEGLNVEFRDYDGDYVDLYGEFDADFFSFPSLFTLR